MYEKIENKKPTGIILSAGGRFETTSFGKKTPSSTYIAKGFYQIVDPRTLTPQGEVFVKTEKVFDTENEVVNIVYTFRDMTTEEITEATTLAMQNKAREMEDAIAMLIQDKIEDYNVANGVSFTNVDALQKYTVVPTYPHIEFVNALLVWNVSVWEYARSIQRDVMSGVRALPTLDELLAELPSLNY